MRDQKFPLILCTTNYLTYKYLNRYPIFLIRFLYIQCLINAYHKLIISSQQKWRVFTPAVQNILAVSFRKFIGCGNGRRMNLLSAVGFHLIYFQCCYDIIYLLRWWYRIGRIYLSRCENFLFSFRYVFPHPARLSFEQNQHCTIHK